MGRIIVKKHLKEMFPAEECVMDPFWDDLVNDKKELKNEKSSNSVKRHTLRDKK